MEIKHVAKAVVSASVLAMGTFSTEVFAEAKASQTEGLNVNVKLSNHLGNRTEIALNVNGTYIVDNNSSFELSSGMYEMKMIKGKIELYKSGKFIKNFGKTVTFKPTKYAYGSYLTINGIDYLGDMRFTNEYGYIRPINTLPFEDYLKGVVPEEMPASWSLEALKTQAVAARTYALGKGVNGVMTDTQDHQVYKGYAWASTPYAEKVEKAVNETRGNILTYKGNKVETLYSSSNGGYIESNTGAYGSALIPYFKAKADKFDPVIKFSYSISETALITKVSPYAKGVAIKNIDSIQITKLTDGKRAETVKLNVKTVGGKNASFTMKGTQLRSALGTMNLKSPYLNKPIKKGNQFEFSGQGFGHGVGMSQYGANEMAKKGYSYKEILGFYYPGTTLEIPKASSEVLETYVPNNENAPKSDGVESWEGTTEVEIPREYVEPVDDLAPLISNTKFKMTNENIMELSFVIDEDSKVQVKVLDSNGKEKKSVLDAAKKSGHVAVTSNLSSLVTGTYTLHLTVKDLAGNQTNFTNEFKVVGKETKYKITLTEPKTLLYDIRSSNATATSSLGEQTVEVVEEQDNWMQVRTWTGLKWISPKNPIIHKAGSVILTKKHSLYNDRKASSKIGASIGEQKISTIATWEGKGWYKVNTWLGEKWINTNDSEKDRVVIFKKQNLYNTLSKSDKAGASVSPQTVEVLRKQGVWLQISTWLGPKWIQPEEYIDTADQKIYSHRRYSLYSEMDVETKLRAMVAPQTLSYVEKNGSWYKISTWIGHKWINLADD